MTIFYGMSESLWYAYRPTLSYVYILWYAYVLWYAYILWYTFIWNLVSGRRHIVLLVMRDFDQDSVSRLYLIPSDNVGLNHFWLLQEMINTESYFPMLIIIIIIIIHKDSSIDVHELCCKLRESIIYL